MSLDLDEVRKRKKLADYYYDNYVKHYQKGDLSKASEFLWGSINNLTYCMGLLDNQRLSTHDKIRGHLQTLAATRQDKEISDGLVVAETIHSNFFHNFMSKDVFDHQRKIVEGLVEKLGMILLQRLEPQGITNQNATPKDNTQ
ncbi:MAG: hypothetical protein FJ358_02515 [Thaumarchaeota archaeon]|nr:hypothetical protein [Nitrososphaerota archaeon]